MTFDHDLGYSFPSLLKKRGEEKDNELAKIGIKGHTFLLDQLERDLLNKLEKLFF